MGVKIHGNWTHDLATEMTHEPSDARLTTMAPVSVGGDGSRFSPIDLLAASAASCAVTAINLRANELGVQIIAVAFSVESEMAEEPRRVAALSIAFDISILGSDDEFDQLVLAGRQCPVKLSLSPEIQVSERFTRVVS